MREADQKPIDRIRSKYGLLALDIIFIILIIFVGFQTGADLTIIVVFLAIVPYMIVTKRKKMIKQFLIATMIAIIWIIIANDQYGYNQSYLTVFEVNLFPLLAWACGLFGTFVIYSHYEHLFIKKGFLFKVLMYVIMYWPILIGIETIAYHLLDIRNLATAQYSGLPLLDSMHAPLWMKISYFSLGPIFFTVCYFMKLGTHNIQRNIQNDDK